MAKTQGRHDRAVRVTHREKALFESGFTKGDLVQYYRAVAEVILPQLAGRPVTRIRFPDGVGGIRFFEKNTPKYAPSWLRRLPLSANPGSAKPAKTVTYPFIDDIAGLEWMSNQAAVELHTPQWRAGPRGGIRPPDRLVIDLDPGEGAGLADCASAAHLIRARLADDGLEAWPVTSGSKGIHLYAALPKRRSARAVHAFVGRIAGELAEAHPDALVAQVGREHRVGRVFIDWSQNSPARSTATPYTLRGRDTPMVAAPREWEELGPDVAQLGPDDVLARLARDGDLMAKHGLTAI
ncbi:non-homologous end-joining DNA ligase [Agromyces ramosus]|uniref:Bifunctional non-homologous end joining protein LigD n=1 Tax=Agromyces ramosus TaxID=33879 RepID=A0ABU0RCI0_9MICO|nr:non-homologous end-joining DNA ligase [Agromyces ramosus]MDQ0895772.1 bifunctional non-homologous end joining protein LigD [Agromyces ramosus]